MAPRRPPRASQSSTLHDFGFGSRKDEAKSTTTARTDEPKSTTTARNPNSAGKPNTTSGSSRGLGYKQADDDEPGTQEKDEVQDDGDLAVLLEEDSGLSRDLIVAAVKKKLDNWGIKARKWTDPTDLELWLRPQPEKGVTYVEKLRTEVEAGASIEHVEASLLPANITRFYWSVKEQLMRSKGQRVVCIMGFCPQYLVDFGDDMASFEPEDSQTLSDLVITWIARNLDCHVITWDMHPDCKKQLFWLNHLLRSQ